MRFQIQEPNHELTEGYFILSIKYFVLILLAWMTDIMILYLYPCFAWEGKRFPPFIMFMNNYHILTWVFTGLYILLFSRKVVKNHNLGLIISFEFDREKLQLELINTLNGKIRMETIPLSNLEVRFEEKNNQLYGKQQIYHFLSNHKLITTLNIQTTPWKKHPDISELIHKLNEKTTPKN